MKFDLIRPCKHCPFSKHPERIRFAARERAVEIEEHAYRKGFVCHEHGESEEDECGESRGIDFRDDGSSQHCFGALAMYLKHGGSGNVPFEWAAAEDPGIEDRWWERVSVEALEEVWDSEEEFIEGSVQER